MSKTPHSASTRTAAIIALTIFAFFFGSPQSHADFFQGFETDNSGWNVYGGTNDATRVPSGTNGITASSGNYYGQAAQATINGGGDGSAATDWGLGGTDTTFGNGFKTSIDIYLQFGTTNDTRFDWDTALNDSAGGFLSDFGFIGGYYNDTDATGTGDRFVINAGNNFGRANSFPKDAGHDPFTILTQGWYTFTQTFTDNAGTLLDTLQIYNTATDTLLHTWTLGGQPIANVGGATYGWVVDNEFSSLAIDNTSLTNNAVPEPATLANFALGAGLMLCTMLWRRRRHAASE